MKDSFMGDARTERKKVFIVGPTESVLTKRGNRHPALAKFLIDDGYDLKYVTSDFYHAEKRWFSKKEIAEAKNQVPYDLKVIRCLGYRKNISVRRVISNSLFSLRVFFYLLPRLNKKTVLILPSRPVEMIFVASMLRLLRGSSVALDIQDIWPDMLLVRSSMKRFFFKIYCNTYLYPSLRFIDKFFHVAPSFINWLHRYAPYKSSVFVPLGYDSERWNSVVPFRKKSSSDPINLVCVALLQDAIDVMPLLEAINRNEHFHLTLIGDDGKGERYPEVISYINRHEMQNVTLIGRVNPEKMWEYLQSMDVGVIPMISSSIPNKFFDYIASYIPILVLGENDTADIVKKLQIGWSCGYNVQGVKDILTQINNEVIEKKRLNICKVRESFDRKNLFRIVLRLLEGDKFGNIAANDIPVVKDEKVVMEKKRQ